MNKQQEPRLRFQGFTGEWEKSAIKDVVNVFDNLRIPVAGSERVSGNTPYFGANGIQDYVDGFTHDGEFVLIAEDGANDLQNYPIQYFNGKGWVNNHAHVLQGKAEILNNLFLFSRFQSMDISRFLVGGGRAKLNSGTMIEIEIEFPKNKKEQIAIGNFFRCFDSQIAESRAVLEKSRQLKKAMLAKMFPANGEKIPKIRFKGFEGEWERNELGCLGYCLSGIGFSENEQGGENGIPFFKVSDMNLSGNEVYLRKANNYVTQEQIDKQRWQVIQQLPCIFFAKVGAALLLNRKRLVNTPFLLDNNTMAFILNSSLDNYFMKTLFDTIDLPALAQIGALPSINAKDIEKNIVFIPTPKEQTAIGSFFRQLDETIALQSAEVEKLNQLKKGLLAAMLV